MTGADAPPGASFAVGRTRSDAQTAKQIADAVVGSRQVAPLFYVKSCTHTFDTSGYSLSVNFENIVGSLPNG